MGPEYEGRFGIVFNVKCYNPKEDKEYHCKTAEENDSGQVKTCKETLIGFLHLVNIAFERA